MTRAVTVKLPVELYQTASDLVALTNVSFRELFAAALEREISQRKSEGGDELTRMLDGMRAFREQRVDA